jgi:hypothetical protein
MGKILTKNSRTPTIDDPLHRLLVVFYDGERDSRYSFFVCCSPQQSVNQHDGRVVRKRGTRAFAMCVRHERPKWDARALPHLYPMTITATKGRDPQSLDLGNIAPMFQWRRALLAGLDEPET